jgi:signal transduction histidine kinase
VAVVQSGRGLALMDSIRQAIDVAVREEEAVLARLTRGERAWAERVTAMIVVGVALTAMVGVLARVAIRRDIDAHEESQHALREAKEAAEAANRAKSDFLARMSHELRTPLNSVIGFSNVLLRQQSDALGATGRLYLERIRDNGMHLLLLIDDLLDISRIEVGRLNLAKQPVALDAVVREALTSFEEEARARGIALTAELPTQAAPVETDPARFRQVVVNLVGNAVKFTQQGRVTVRLHVDPATGVPLRLDVVDTGVGIPRDRQAAVFEAFEQADTGTARQFGGTGLGLAISRALCDALGYRLDLAWSEPGVGSAFTVALAAGAAAIPAPGPARPLDMATVPGSGTG